ncbi:ATP-binding protein [Halorubellus sp. PRR65]|uniref:ATP-binding protein n=1 Tax=Halorubellus sp. PRR65 TaxID=3098148 RepID=UPI002B25AD07|nr:ATP-binding protein [Halorubellus sp. PRR65]
MRETTWHRSTGFVLVLGATLFLIAVAHHAREYVALGGGVGPVVALLLDGLPALALAYGGYRLAGSGLSARQRRLAATWCALGGALFGSVMIATFVVRSLEGRPLIEPVFPLLIAFEAGATAGLIAGYSRASARAEAQRARTVSDALTFVNRLMRHDLRNDLATIQMYANLEDGDDAEAPAGHGRAAVVGEKAEEALDRIETSRSITETFVGDPEFDAVDLVPMVEALAARVEDSFGVSVETEFAGSGLVRANAGLQSVVDNLLENAAEHNDAAEPVVRVRVESDGDTVRLLVSDNGPGIPDERKRTLFERDDGEPGSGLSLVNRLLGQYGGDVRVSDNDPQGTTFVVTLPRATRGPS